MNRKMMLIEALKSALEKRRAQHVQLLTRTWNGNLCVKFVSVDTNEYRNKIMALANEYCESLELVKETKTTLTYIV